VLVKPQFLIGPLIVLLAGRRWRELAGLGGISAILGALSLHQIGISGVRDYLMVAADVTSWVKRGSFYRIDMHTPNALLHSWLPSGIVDVAVLLVGVLIAGALFWRCLHHYPGHATAVSIAAVGTLLLAPYAHTHDLLILAVPWLLLGPIVGGSLSYLLAATYLAPFVNLWFVALGGPGQLTVLANGALLTLILQTTQALKDDNANDSGNFQKEVGSMDNLSASET
jgi:hypothetical protein